ncbi:MAG: fasciclin domain-containing protein [Chitinophagales bacterium]
MKYLTKFLFIALISSTFLFQSCDDDDNITTMSNITTTAVGDPELSTLVAALTRAGLVDDLNATGPFTVFAPTNAAFQDLLDNNNFGWNSLDDIDDATLTAVLLYHVVSGSVKSTDLSTDYVPSLSDGAAGTKADIYVDITSGVVLNGSTTVTTADIMATNGVIHKINKALLPPTVVDIALNNSNFTSLVAALTRTGNTTDFVSVLSGTGPFTVFAPTNTAFQALLDSNNDWTTLADIPEPTLDAVLKYHVVNNANVLAGTLTDGQVVTTLGGSTFEIDLSTGAQIVTGSNATNVNIIITDVQGTNGVVHAVDQVLLP